jgi:two-component system phosphate regulon response regulator PhoB
MAKIFVIEDNENLREAVTSYLRLDEHQVYEFDKIKGVLEAIKQLQPDLLILDVMLPDGDGFLLAKTIKEKYTTPLLFLTAKSAESDRITGFELGADDYVVKPFSPKELTLRVKAILKRIGVPAPSKASSAEWVFKDHHLMIDRQAHKVLVNKEEQYLTAAEWEILDFLVRHTGIVITRSQLLTQCLAYSAEVSDRTIDTHIKNIRIKLKEVGWIETVRGYGYRFAGKHKD